VGKPHADFSASFEYVRNIIEAVTPELYAVFESEARSGCAVERKVIGQYSPQHSDWHGAVWTEDADSSARIAAWIFRYWRRGVDYKSNRDFLKGQAKSLESQDD